MTENKSVIVTQLWLRMNFLVEVDPVQLNLIVL